MEAIYSSQKSYFLRITRRHRTETVPFVVTTVKSLNSTILIPIPGKCFVIMETKKEERNFILVALKLKIL
jgi:hypothetical protein